MPKYVPTTLSSTLSNSAASQINENLERISSQLEDTVSRSGETPNHMGADLDLNSNDILNVDTIDADTIEIENLVYRGAPLEVIEFVDASQFATAEQGLLADSAIQPGDPVGLLSDSASFKVMTAEERQLLENPGLLPVTTRWGTYQRFLSNKLGDVLSAEDFGVQKGVASDQSVAMNSMIDALIQNPVSYLTDLKQVQHEIDLGPGTIRLDNPLTPLPFGFRIRGRGAEATKFLSYGAFPVWSSAEFLDDGITLRYHNSLRLEDFAVISSDPSNPSQVARLRGTIRNCALERVGHQGCDDAYDIDNTWTLRMTDCFGVGITGQTNHHILLGTNVGGIVIDGGRYDVSDEPHLYATGSDTFELFIRNDAAFQFGKKAGIKVLSARTVDIDGAFLEGNCIGNPASYYLELNGSGSSLTQARVRGVVMNNLADANRDGLGIAFFDAFETVDYTERWTRNNVAIVPKFGTGVTRAILNLQSATAMAAAELPFVAANPSSSVEIRQVARPTKLYGKVLTSTVMDTAADTAGRLGEGCVARGTLSTGVAAIQGHTTNTASTLDLNPFGGDVRTGLFYSRRSTTSSNFTPTVTTPNATIDTTAATRDVLLTTNGASFPIGTRCEFVKSVAANSLNITLPVGDTFLGGALNTKAVTAIGRYVVEKISATVWMLNSIAVT